MLVFGKTHIHTDKKYHSRASVFFDILSAYSYNQENLRMRDMTNADLKKAMELTEGELEHVAGGAGALAGGLYGGLSD